MHPDGTLSPRLYSALELAFKLHGRDTRKRSQVPMMAHLLGVCALVQNDGGDEDEAIAALLHDSLEDKPELITREEIKACFGDRVLCIVAAATDTPEDYAGGEKPPWKERKGEYLSRIQNVDPSLLRVTVADKIDNLWTIIADYNRVGEALWARFNASSQELRWYYTSALKAYKDAGYKGKLLQDMEHLLPLLDKIVSR